VGVLAFGLAGCSASAPDPCAGQTAVCLGLRVEGDVGELDGIRIFVHDTAGLHSAQPTPPSAPFSLPIQMPLLLPADVTGPIAVMVVGEHNGTDVAAGSSDASVPPGEQLVTVTLASGLGGAKFPGNDDGPCNVAGGVVDLSAGSCVGRTQPDAAAWLATSALVPGARTLTVGAAPTALAPGDEILIVDAQGTASDFASVGNYETTFVVAIAGSTLTLFPPLAGSYDGTKHKILVQRLPRYTSLGVGSGGTLTAAAWDGMRGGVLAVRVLGGAMVSGTITMAGKGYRGGKAGSGNGPESFGGLTISTSADALDGTSTAGGDGGGDGTGGGAGYKAVSGDPGGVGHGGGGGGGRGFYDMSGWVAFGNGGGGGSFASAGPLAGDNRLLLGSGGTQGAGGGGGGGYYSGQGPGKGGHSDGTGGTGGASTYTMAAIGMPGGKGTDGSAGGGAILLWAASLTASTDALVADGGPGGQGGVGGQGGGGIGAGGGGEGGQGGGGGTVIVHAPPPMLAANAAHATGGAGGQGGDGNGQTKAAGGMGAPFAVGNDPGMNGKDGTFENGCGGPPGGCWIAGGGGGRGGRSGFAGRVTQGAN
jgi:hypothetical protein